MIVDIKQKNRLIHQRVSVTFNYEIYFTQNLFELKNPTLAQVISADEETKPKKVVAVVDAGILKYQPELVKQLVAYTKFYGEVLAMAA